MKSALLIIFGCLFLGLGGIGILLPVLPTTPFVLLAAGCFCGSSPAMYRWLSANRFFGAYVRNYKEKTGIGIRTKVWSLLFLWVTLAVSMVLANFLHVTLLLLAVGVGVTLHIICIRPKQN